MFRGKKAGMGAVNRFNQRGPAIPPQKDYTPVRPGQKLFGTAEIEAASQFPQDSPEFITFVEDVVNMAAEMAPAVSEAIHQQKWKISPNPLASIRTAAHQAANRLGIEHTPAGQKPR